MPTIEVLDTHLSILWYITDHVYLRDLAVFRRHCRPVGLDLHGALLHGDGRIDPLMVRPLERILTDHFSV